MLKIPELKMTLQTEPFPPTPLLTLSPPPGGAHPGGEAALPPPQLYEAGCITQIANYATLK